jgi:hypothetical protein
MRIAFNPNATMAWFASLMDHQQQYHAGHRPWPQRRSSARVGA